ncbi:MAG: hypothetical protein ABI035_09465 [Gemmatimonadaceae bacterium]
MDQETSRSNDCESDGDQLMKKGQVLDDATISRATLHMIEESLENLRAARVGDQLDVTALEALADA